MFNNYSNFNENSEWDDDNKYETNKYNNQFKINALKNTMKYDIDYINNLFENYYNTDKLTNQTALEAIQSYQDDNHNDLYRDMPALIPIDEFFDNNIINNQIIIHIPDNFENNLNNLNNQNIELNNLTIENNDIIFNNPILEAQNNANDEDELNQEYIDIDINEVEPYHNNNESCSIM